MTLNEQILLIAETLDTEARSLKPETVLNDLEEWDSMGTISIIAMLDKKFNRVLNLDQIISLQTVKDILDLMTPND